MFLFLLFRAACVRVWTTFTAATATAIALFFTDNKIRNNPAECNRHNAKDKIIYPSHNETPFLIFSPFPRLRFRISVPAVAFSHNGRSDANAKNEVSCNRILFTRKHSRLFFLLVHALVVYYDTPRRKNRRNNPTDAHEYRPSRPVR